MNRISSKIIGAALIVFTLGAAFGFSTGAAHAQTPFYQASAQQIAGPPGTIIRSEPMLFAPACNLSNTPPVWERLSPPSNGEPAFRAGAPASDSAAAERGHRGCRRPLD